MCEYCGCQELDVIGQLTREHEQLRNLGRRLADAVNRRDSAAVQRHAGEMLELLGPHTRVEERGLFPELADDFGEQLAELEGEHVVIETTLTSLAVGDFGDGWAGRAHAALALLFDHILKEQDGVFPAALANLSTAGWERVTRARVALSFSA